MTDLLGRRGGPVSVARGVTETGVVVGDAAGRGFVWKDGGFTWLGVAGEGSHAAAVDAGGGRVVGARFVGPDTLRACVWEEGHRRELDRIEGFQLSSAADVNTRGQVVGVCFNPGSAAVMWDEGRMIDLGSLGGGHAVASAVNDHGVVVGASRSPTGATRAFVWQDGHMRDLGTLGGLTSQATAVNEQGQVVGVSETAEGVAHAFLWSDGEMNDLGTLGGTTSHARDVNAAGEVVGVAINRDKARRAFLWRDGVMTDLGTLGGFWSEANAINDHGQVVGIASTGAGATGFPLRPGGWSWEFHAFAVATRSGRD
jgi:probable HAF family extracellular repeat protein